MKRISLFLALTALMVFSFGLVHGQYGGISLDHMDGLYSGDSVLCGTQIGFHMRMTNTSACPINGSTNGFRVWMVGGGLRTPITWGIHTEFDWAAWYDLTGGLVATPFSADGTGSDTVGFGGAKLMGPGVAAGFDEEVWHIFTTVDPSAEGDTLCIDSCYYPPAGQWIWAMPQPCGTYYPTWSGPHCFVIYNIPDQNWKFSDCPTEVVHNTHCEMAQHVLHAYDQDTEDPEPTATFTLLPPSIGQIAPGGDANTIVWSYQPTIQDVCVTYEICIEVDDGMGGPTDICCFLKHFTNEPPTWTLCPYDTFYLAYPNEKCVNVAAVDDCDPLSFGLFGVDPVPGPGAIYYVTQTSALTAEVCFTCDPNDLGLFEFTIFVTDQIDTTFQVITFNQIEKIKWDVVIEKTEKTVQGTHEYVDVSLVGESGEEIGGFDFLIAYDASALNFIMAQAGPLYCPIPEWAEPWTDSVCNWEYFTYRYGAFGNCGNQCPSGLLRVVGIAETNNGPVHPACFVNPPALPLVLFRLDFLVTDDRTFECSYVPIRFFWMDCGDNVLSSVTGDTLWVEKEIFNYVGPKPISHPDCVLGPDGITYYLDITNHYFGWPSYFGMQEDPCIDPTPDSVWDPINEEWLYKNPQRFINFYNGGIDIVCAESLDTRGDINLNGLANEIADAVLYSNYFIYGLGVFHINFDGQVAASDVNADGMVLTVGDLVYQIRIVIGDAQAYPKLAPVEANYVVDKGVVSVDAEMGAALVVVEGDITPTLLAENMDIKYAYNAEENVTRVLVYSFEGNGFSGEFLNANGNVVSIELGSYEGAVVKATEIPANFALNQNYPNPFNPVTTISFNLPVASEYTLTVYNVTGQVVTQFAGEAEAGVVELEWDASTNASGIYFYKLNAGDFSATKKMVLLK